MKRFSTLYSTSHGGVRDSKNMIKNGVHGNPAIICGFFERRASTLLVRGTLTLYSVQHINRHSVLSIEQYVYNGLNIPLLFRVLPRHTEWYLCPVRMSAVPALS